MNAKIQKNLISKQDFAKILQITNHKDAVYEFSDIDNCVDIKLGNDSVNVYAEIQEYEVARWDEDRPDWGYETFVEIKKELVSFYVGTMFNGEIIDDHDFTKEQENYLENLTINLFNI